MDCEMLEKCGFFNNFCKSNSAAAGFCSLYCKSHEKSNLCERKKYRLKNGNPPPDNMAPTGKML